MKNGLLAGLSALALVVGAGAAAGQTLTVDDADHNGIDAVGIRTLVNNARIDQTEGTENPAAAVVMSVDGYRLVNNGTIVATVGRGITSTDVVNADSLINYGLIDSSDRSALWVTGTAGLVLNEGRIRSSGPGAAGIVVEGKAKQIINNGFIANDGSNGMASDTYVEEMINTGSIFTFGSGLDTQSAGRITNSGKIGSTQGYGIVARTGAEFVENSGSITADGHGIALQQSGEVVNSGTIESNDSGVWMRNPTSFTNTGTIKATGWGVTYGKSGTVLNEGTIEGATVGVGTNGFNEVGDTVLINNGTIRVVEQAGTTAFSPVQMYVTDTGTATLINHGTIETDSSNPTSIGVLMEDLYGQRGSSAVVTNSGTIAGAFNAIRFSYVGEARVNLLTGSRIFGNISFRDGYSNSLIDFSKYSGNTVLAVNYLDAIEPGDRSYVWENSDPSLSHLAIFDVSGIDGSVVGDGLADVMRTGNEMIAAQASDADAPTEPNAYAVVARGPAETAVLSAIDTGQPAQPRWWLGSFGGGSTEELSRSGFGGMLGGVQFDADALTVGITGGASVSVTASIPAQRLDTRSFLLGFYGETDLGAAVINGSLLGAYSMHASTREVIAPTGVEEARGEFASLAIAPSLGFAFPVLTEGANTLNVDGSVTYIGGMLTPYTETGSSMNIAFGPQRIGFVDARLGLSQTHSEGDTTLKVKAGLFAQNNFGTGAIPVSLYGIDTTVASGGGVDAGVYGGLGLSTQMGPVNVSLNLDGTVGMDGGASGAAKAMLGGTF